MIFSQKVNDLFEAQLQDWDLAKVNYSNLKKVKTRKLNFLNFEILVQYNPERMRSSAAKVDVKSIEARPCFLCSKNRPDQQSGLAFEEDMTILVNPFPIFMRHLTVPSENHTDQRILGNFGKMLNLAASIPDYLVFYNGPQCGASAPDHLHFQAGNRGFLPIETDFPGGKFTKLLSVSSGVEIWHWHDYLRGMITLKGTDIKNLILVFNKFYEKFSISQSANAEPMLNIITYSGADGFIVHIIPRRIHRPSQFFSEGNDQILLSPASVDLGGVIITPREEDFYKITPLDVKDIFTQVCISEKEIMGFL